MPDDKKGRVKINPKIVAEHKREQKEGYKGTVEEYYEEFYGPIPDGFEKGGTVKKKEDSEDYEDAKENMSEAEKRMLNRRPYMKEGGEVIVGKGKDYIKDLI